MTGLTQPLFRNLRWVVGKVRVPSRPMGVPMILHSLMERGEQHRKRLQFKKAEVCFREALRLAPQDLRALFCLADSLRGLGRFQEAAPYWDEILTLEPEGQKGLSRAGPSGSGRCLPRLG